MSNFWQLANYQNSTISFDYSWFLAKSISYFLSLPWKLHNRYCHTLQLWFEFYWLWKTMKTSTKLSNVKQEIGWFLKTHAESGDQISMTKSLKNLVLILQIYFWIGTCFSLNLCWQKSNYLGKLLYIHFSLWFDRKNLSIQKSKKKKKQNKKSTTFIATFFCQIKKKSKCIFSPK